LRSVVGDKARRFSTGAEAECASPHTLQDSAQNRRRNENSGEALFSAEAYFRAAGPQL
jgi:hypothetical protein